VTKKCRRPWKTRGIIEQGAEVGLTAAGRQLEDPNIRGYDAIRRVFLLEMAKVLAGHD
jgi:hypothetical protein